MSPPTHKVRQQTYQRDQYRCVACGSTVALEYQHRRAAGMGGTKQKPRYEDGCTACTICNARFEADLQSLALARGWKVRRHNPLPNHLVPVFYVFEQEWFLLTVDGDRAPLDGAALQEYRGLAGMTEWEV